MQFPSDLPAPSVGMTVETKGDHQKVQFDGGSRIIRRARRRPNIVQVAWRVTEAQRVALEAFYYSAGVSYFLLSLPSPAGWTEQQVRFTGQLSFTYLSTDSWDCSAALMMPLPQYMTEAQLEHELIYMLGDWTDLSFAQKLDATANTKLPQVFSAK